MVGHGGQLNYARRVRLRLQQEVNRQIGDGGWAAFYWTNGSPFRDVIDGIRWEDLPTTLAGLIFVGDAVAFPHANVHSFTTILRRDVQSTSAASIISKVHNELPRLVLERFEASSGVRALMLADASRHGTYLLRRDGTERILPFNLLMDRDPKRLTKDETPPRP